MSKLSVRCTICCKNTKNASFYKMNAKIIIEKKIKIRVFDREMIFEMMKIELI